MLIITGLAGAGKTIALDTLEDLGYYCIDNLPSALLASLVRDFAPKQAQPVAVAMDSRNAVDLAALPEKIRELRQQAEIQILFLCAATAKRAARTRCTSAPKARAPCRKPSNTNAICSIP